MVPDPFWMPPPLNTVILRLDWGTRGFQAAHTGSDWSLIVGNLDGRCGRLEKYLPLSSACRVSMPMTSLGCFKDIFDEEPQPAALKDLDCLLLFPSLVIHSAATTRRIEDEKLERPLERN